jgi:hypothetical protein
MLPLAIVVWFSHVCASQLPMPGATPTSPILQLPPPPQPTVFTFNPRFTRRNILTDLDGDVNSILSGLGSAIPSYVASGVPNFFQDFPTGTAVQSSLGLSDGDVAALPTQVLNLPYVSLLRTTFISKLSNRVGAMRIGPRRAGVWWYMETFSSSQTFHSRSSTIWQTSSSSTPPFPNSTPAKPPRHVISPQRSTSYSNRT